MALNLLHRLIYSFLSGFSEFVFVPVHAHQFLYRTITGHNNADPVMNLVIHLGSLAALVICCSRYMKHLHYEKKLQQPTRRKRVRQPDPAALMDMRIINTAAIVTVIGTLLIIKTKHNDMSPAGLGFMVLLNGIVVFIPRLVNSGNKDGHLFTLLDGFLIGLAAIFGNISGFNRLGCMYTVGTLCGADKSYCMNLCLTVSVPLLLLSVIIELISIFSLGVALSFFGFLGYVLAAIAAFLGAYLSISLLRYIGSRATFTCLAYYNWGLAIFLLLVALITP